MKLVTTKAIAKVAAVATGLAMLTAASTFALSADAASLSSAQIQSILSLLSSFGADSATIANVNAALTGTAMTTTTSTSGMSSCSFTTDLTIGSSGATVTCLQDALIAAGYSIPAGATGYFGAETQAAVAAWQKAVGVSPAAGYFGAISRAHWNLGGSSTTTTTTTTGTGTVGIGSGNGLEVALSPTSPSGTVLVQGQGIGDLADFVFSNPTSAAITVTGVTFNRIGVSNDATINNVYLYNGLTRVTDSAGVSNSQFSFTDAGGLFTVEPGQTYTLSVRADIATGTSGQQIGASLVSVSSSGTLASTDSFPINGGYQTISAANLATVNFQSGDTESNNVWSGSTLPSGAQTISPQTGYTLWQNTVSVSQNPVWLSAMTFTNLGSIDASDLQNITLYVDGVDVATAASGLSSERTVTFDPASPLELNTGSHVIRVVGDIDGGSSLTVQFSLQYSSDAMFVDSQLMQPVTPTVNSSNFTAVSGSPITIQSVGASGVSVTKDPSSPSSNIAVGSTDQNLATFDMLASGEPTKVQDLYVCATVSGGSSGDGEGLQNGLIEFNGAQVGSTKNIVECNGSASTDFSLGSQLILPAGQTAKVSVFADESTATTSVGTGSTVTITLVQGSSNAQGQDSLTSTSVPAGNISGNGISVTSSSLTAAEATGYGNQSAVAGTPGFKIGSFVLQAGSTGSLSVNQIGIVLGGSSTSTLQNLLLKDDATGLQIGSTVNTPGQPSASSTYTFNANFTLPSSSTKTIDVYADLPSNASNAGTITTAVSHTATNATSQNGQAATIGSSDVDLQTVTFGSGSLTVALGASNPVSANIVAGAGGATGIEAGDFNFSANTSSYTATALEVAVPTASAAAISGPVSIHYTDVNGNPQTASASLTNTASTTADIAYFNNLTMYIPANGSSDLSVWLTPATITTGPTTISGTAITVKLVGLDGTNVQVKNAPGTLINGINSGVDIFSNANTGYGQLVVRQSVPSFNGTSASSNTAPSSSTVLYEFTVNADAHGQIDLDKVSFTVGTSTMSASGFSLYTLSNPGTALNTSGVNATGAGLVSIQLTQPYLIPASTGQTFIVKASTISGWASGASLSVSLAPADASLISNNQVSALSSDSYIWSDRSANNDSVSSLDWTNGYLLRDLVDGTYSFTANF
jgi:hypothetical protein